MSTTNSIKYPEQGFHTFFIAIVFGFVLTHGLYANSVTCSDQFESDSLMGSWKFVDLTENDGAQAKLQNGELKLTARGLDVYNEKNYFAGLVRKDIVGDFDVSVKITSQSPVHPWSQTGIMVINNLEARSQGGYSFISVSPENGVRFFWDANGVVGETNQNHAGVEKVKLPVWIRMKKEGVLMSSWFKTDPSGNWREILLNAKPQSVGKNSQIVLYSFSHNESVSGVVTMDDFACLHGEFPLSSREFLVKDTDISHGNMFNVLGQTLKPTSNVWPIPKKGFVKIP